MSGVISCVPIHSDITPGMLLVSDFPAGHFGKGWDIILIVSKRNGKYVRSPDAQWTVLLSDGTVTFDWSFALHDDFTVLSAGKNAD